MASGYDVVVVGAGIGGLTVAALLSARGMNVCVLERQSQVGGCVGRVEFFGYEFEPGMGIYTSFGRGEIYDRIFAELPVDAPETSLLARPYVVRLADGSDVELTGGKEFSDELSRAFPECAREAIVFYRQLSQANPRALEFLSTSSPRFQSFVQTQVRGFLHRSIDRCSFATVKDALARARGPLYEIHGGTASLAQRLAESLKRSGGTLRLNTPVLRLAYDSNGAAVGVDLLNGEQVLAQRAIVSNLTIWDTFGKLVGLNRTSPEIKKLMNALDGSGAYVVYATLDPGAVTRLPSERLLAAARSEVTNGSAVDEGLVFSEFTLAAGNGTATLKAATNVNDWFAYHASEEEFEDSDQAVLEQFWTKLHAALPELGGDIEVIETANPRTCYDLTRRKLGMVMGIRSLENGLSSSSIASISTVVGNLFITGDTVSAGPNLASVSEHALSLARHLEKNL